ncbi:MAG: hypothetical protein AB7U75_22440, partial [Hyphomicrobiaceae bacterium]
FAIGACDVGLSFGSSHQPVKASAWDRIADTFLSAIKVSLGPIPTDTRDGRSVGLCFLRTST